MGGALAGALEVALLVSNHWAQAAVSVPSHQPGELVLKLRRRIVVDERELGPRRKRQCSSLEQGPFCTKIDGPGASSATGLVDGVISQQLRDIHPEAFHWDLKGDQTMARAVAKLRERLRGEEEEDNVQRGARPRPRCFELQLRRLPPSFSVLPEFFGEGLPTQAAPRWEGEWQVLQCPLPASPATKLHFGEAQPGRGPCLLSHGNKDGTASVKFTRPLVLHRLVIGIPDSVARLQSWERGSYVCGRREGYEKWCRDIAHIAEDASASKTHGAGDGTFYRDVGDSFKMIDEVVFSRIRPEGLLLSSIGASLSPDTEDQEQVVLLLHRTYEIRRKLPVAPPGPFEAEVVSISGNAAVWTAEEILTHGLSLSGYTSGVEQLRNQVKFLVEEAARHRKRVEQSLAATQEKERRWQRQIQEREEALKAQAAAAEAAARKASRDEISNQEPQAKPETVVSGALQEQLADAISELLEAFGVEGTEEELERSLDEKLEKLQLGNEVAKAAPTGQVEVKVQELLEEMTTSLLERLFEAGAESSGDFLVPKAQGSKDKSEESSRIRDP